MSEDGEELESQEGMFNSMSIQVIGRSGCGGWTF